MLRHLTITGAAVPDVAHIGSADTGVSARLAFGAHLAAGIGIRPGLACSGLVIREIIPAKRDSRAEDNRDGRRQYGLGLSAPAPSEAMPPKMLRTK